MKYPLQTESKPVSGIAAKKLLEAIDSSGAVVNDRMLALAKCLATRCRRKALKMANSGKFDGVDFSKLDIELLTPELRQLGQGFRCVRGEFVIKHLCQG